MSEDDDGLGNYTESLAPDSGFTDVGIISTYPMYDATRGHLAMFGTYAIGVVGCESANQCKGWGYCFSDGDTNAITCDYTDALAGGVDVEIMFLTRTTTTDLPLYVFKQNEDLYIGTNTEKNASGTWSNSTIFSQIDQNIVTRVSITPLSTGGYGCFFRYKYVSLFDTTGASDDHLFVFMETSDASGMTGWGAEDILFQESDLDILYNGGVGVDGDGYPFIAHGNGTSGITIWTNDNTQGTGTWSVSSTINMPVNCTSVGVDTQHILLTDDTPAILAFCQDGALYFVKCSNSSATQSWNIQNILDSGAYVDAESASLSLALSGNGAPHVSYLKPQNLGNDFALHVIQSTHLDSF